VQTLADMGRPKDALEHCERALELRPRSAEALRRLAALRMATGDMTGAVTAFKEALKIEPDNVVDLLMLAKLIARIGPREEAAALARRALDLEPGSAEAEVLLQLLGGRTKAEETDSGGGE